MGKIVRTVLKIAAIAVQFIPGIGQLASLAITIGLSLLSTALAPKNPKVSPAQRDRLFATIDPSAPRKIVFGSTAMATDIRYEEWGGTDQEYLDRIIAVASHKVQAIREIWIEDKLAWTSASGVTSTYAGYLTVQTRLEGTSANTIAINGGGKWGSSRRLTGCAYVHMRFKTTGNSKKASSPFASSIPQRLTIIGDGALLYDPRQDSTVGGSGTQRANDQSTWAWTSDNVGNNVALQELFYLLGWKINGKLAVGRGIPPSRIDMASFIAAANMCEENVTLAVGGTEKRYRGAGVVSEADAPSAVLEAMHASCAGTLRDASGKLALSILYNDLASPVTAFTDDDVIGQFQWQATRSLDDSFNIVRGRRTDPSTSALYQLVDYPPVSLTSPDGLERTHTFDLSMVQSASQAQRLAKQELQRAQYQGVFSAKFKATGLRATVGQVVTLTFSPLAFAAKLFRITEQTINMDGTVDLTLREENAAIYAWATEETAAVVAAAPITYDPLNSPLIQGIEAAPSIISFPVAPPTDVAENSLYIDAKNRQFLFIGTDVVSGTANDAVVSGAAADAVVSSGWIDKQDFGIAEAQAAADAAQLVVDRIASDGWLTAGAEKSDTIVLQSALVRNHDALIAKATALGVAITEQAAATAAINALNGYLLTLDPAWDDVSTDTPINGVTLRTLFDTAHDKVALLQAAIQGISGTSAVDIYIRQYTPPSTPTGDNPSGWLVSPPTGAATLWKSSGTKAPSGALIGVWSPPVEITQGDARSYSSGDTYYLRNLVTFNGGTYIQLQASSTGNAPTGTDQANSFWGVFAAPGSPGAPATLPGAFTSTIDLTSATGANLRTLANAAGYTGLSDATITFRVPNGVTVRGAPGGGIGIDTGSWPSSSYAIALTIVVQSGGIVDGGGGNGGTGGGGGGGNGGDAFFIRTPITGGLTINAGGTVRGGGAGGNGGAGTLNTPPRQFPQIDDPYDGGGGGGGGRPNGIGGAGELGANGGADGGTGTTATTTTTGVGGSPNGGNGGSFATAAGGTAGYAVRKNGNAVTVTNNGTMTGTAA